MGTTTISTMAKRVLASASVGVLAGAFPIDPINLALFQHFAIHNDYWFTISLSEAVKISLERAPGMAILGFIVASPLIAIAVVTGFVCRRSIDRHPLLWAIAAPVLVWIFTCAVFAYPDDSQTWLPHRSFLQRMAGTMQGIDNTLFFFAPAVAALCFAILTHRAARHA